MIASPIDKEKGLSLACIRTPSTYELGVFLTSLNVILLKDSGLLDETFQLER